MRHLIGAAVAVAVLAATAAALGAAQARADTGPLVTVMTHNLYFGTSLDPVVAAVLNPSSTATDLLTAVGNAYEEAQASDFALRAKAWAAEIAAAKPDLVGLQEAVQWRTGPYGNAPATNDAGDFVQLLLAALSARGQHYVVASESTGYDVQAPGLLPGGVVDVRLTQHEVILARAGAGMLLSNPQSGAYDAELTLSGPFGSFPLPWSWASVDVTIHGHAFRFATTHLDPDVGAYQSLQEEQFLATGPGTTALPLVWVGDFNSDAGASTITGIVPDTSTYRDAIAAGFTDSWTATRSDPGFTCCEAEDLLNPTPTLDQRIDYVLTRGPITPRFDYLVGASPLERLLFGRWPSDHAGVVAVLRLG